MAPLAVAWPCVSTKIRTSTAANAGALLRRPGKIFPPMRAFGRRSSAASTNRRRCGQPRMNARTARRIEQTIGAIARRTSPRRRRRIVVTRPMDHFEAACPRWWMSSKNPRFLQRDTPIISSIRVRSAKSLGVHEAPSRRLGHLDEAPRCPRRDHVVVMQGDRAMPGQKRKRADSRGHVMLPSALSASPKSPAADRRSCTIRTSREMPRHREAPSASTPTPPRRRVHPALMEWGKVLGNI